MLWFLGIRLPNVKPVVDLKVKFLLSFGRSRCYCSFGCCCCCLRTWIAVCTVVVVVFSSVDLTTDPMTMSDRDRESQSTVTTNHMRSRMKRQKNRIVQFGRERAFACLCNLHVFFASLHLEPSGVFFVQGLNFKPKKNASIFFCSLQIRWFAVDHFGAFVNFSFTSNWAFGSN